MTQPTLLDLVPVLAPVLGAGGYAALGWRRASAWLGTATAAIMLAAAVRIAVAVTATGPYSALAGMARVDALSALMLMVIGAVALLATLATPAHFAAEIAAGRATARTARRHCLLVQLFLAAMAGAVLAANLGVLWVAVEATTICTAFLVGQRRERGAVEAAWKYVVICSTGIALALLGTLLLNYAASHAPGGAGLDLGALAAVAPGLDPGVTRIAVVLLLIGFGTKAGLAPLHAWLPDAHSQAPSPVSALMSGVLLSVAFYAMLRVKVIADGALGAGFARALLLVMALASLVVAASLMLAQRDLKRLLAYSSMEHLGLVALGAAIGGPLALAAVLLHILGHGLAKAALFLGAGRILQLTGTTRIDDPCRDRGDRPASEARTPRDPRRDRGDRSGSASAGPPASEARTLRGLGARAPGLACLFGLGTLALVGLPPFSLFASELGIARAGFAAGLGWPTAAALLLMLVIAAALVGHVSRMLLGAPAPEGPGTATAPLRLSPSTAIALGGGLLACAALGVAAGPIDVLLRLAAAGLGGAP